MGCRTIAHRFYVMDTEAFDFVVGTHFFVQHTKIQSLTLQAPYLPYMNRAAKISLTRAVCAARASSSVWMAGDTCPVSNARICWIAKIGHKLSVAGRLAARLCSGVTPACCRPFRWNRPVADHSLVCCQIRRAHRHRQ